jgi:hypothetical protein
MVWPSLSCHAKCIKKLISWLWHIRGHGVVRSSNVGSHNLMHTRCNRMQGQMGKTTKDMMFKLLRSYILFQCYKFFLRRLLFTYVAICLPSTNHFNSIGKYYLLSLSLTPYFLLIFRF